jgi:hypothetical protein
MRGKTHKSPSGAARLNGQSGQASILLLIMMATFLLASVGFAVDLSSMWFHRQAAQSAADAACVAGAMDMLYLTNGTLKTSPGFVVGTPGDCYSSAITALCQYANFNGYGATTSATGWGTSTPVGAIAVSWSFPSSVSGVKGASGVSYPFLNVVVQEKAASWFMGLVGVRSLPVGASCACGLTPGTGGAPLIILNPTIAGALTLSGGSHIVIVGGPQTSIQVNSSANGSPFSNSSSNAVACNGGAGFPIDTSQAGPLGNGGNVAVVGGPLTNQLCGGNYIMNNSTNALWKSPAGVVSDPYASTPVPTLPLGKVREAVTPVATVAQGYTPNSDATYGYIYGTWVASGTDSCPNTAAQQHYLTYSGAYPYNGGLIYGNCLEFTPGYYPNGIDTSSLAGYSNDVVIFMPGVYYLNGNLNVGSATTIRNAWVGTQPASTGVMFHFLTGGPLFSGGSGAASSVVTTVPSYYVNCSGTSIPTGMPVSLSGNVLVSQCSGSGTYVGTPSSDSFSATGSRGILFFAAHSNIFNNTIIGAGATLNFAGVLYFHNANYADVVQLSGAGGFTNYAVGRIVVDQLTLSGSGIIGMNLTGSTSTTTAQVGVFR